MPSGRWRGWAAVIAGLLLLGAGPRTLFADDGETFEENRRKIESLPAAERERLQRNFSEFRSLPEEEQEKIRTLHERIEADRQNGGRLDDVMRAFAEWLKNLTPYQRKDLLDETDPQKRLEIVRELMRQQEEQEFIDSLSREERSELRRAKDDPEKYKELLADFRRKQETGDSRPRFRWRGWHRLPKFAPEEFQAILNVIESHTEFPEERRQQMQNAQPKDRHLLILHTAIFGRQRDGNERPDRESGEYRPPDWPDETLQQKIMAVITDEPFRKRYNECPDPRRCQGLLRTSLCRTLVSEWWDAAGQPEPTEEELQAFFAGLDPEEKEAIKRGSREDQHRRLMFRYRRNRLSESEFASEYSDVRDVVFWGARNQSFRGGHRGGRHPDGRPPHGARDECGRRPPLDEQATDCEKSPDA